MIYKQKAKQGELGRVTGVLPQAKGNQMFVLREAAKNIQRGGGSLNLTAFGRKVLAPLDFLQQLCTPPLNDLI